MASFLSALFGKPTADFRPLAENVFSAATMMLPIDALWNEAADDDESNRVYMMSAQLAQDLLTLCMSTHFSGQWTEQAFGSVWGVFASRASREWINHTTLKQVVVSPREFRDLHILLTHSTWKVSQEDLRNHACSMGAMFSLLRQVRVAHFQETMQMAILPHLKKTNSRLTFDLTQDDTLARGLALHVHDHIFGVDVGSPDTIEMENCRQLTAFLIGAVRKLTFEFHGKAF